jgi:hypothetical protein
MEEPSARLEEGNRSGRLAEAQRTEQENFDWACGMVVVVIELVGFALFILMSMGTGH